MRVSGHDLHLAFAESNLTPAQVDAIAQASVARLVEAAKADHRGWVKSIEDAVAGTVQLDPAALSTHHSCRLGRWYDGVTDEYVTGTRAFAALHEPHRQLHAEGRAVLLALQAGNKGDVAAHMAKLQAALQGALGLLDQMQAQYGPQRQAA